MSNYHSLSFQPVHLGRFFRRLLITLIWSKELRISDSLEMDCRLCVCFHKLYPSKYPSGCGIVKSWDIAACCLRKTNRSRAMLPIWSTYYLQCYSYWSLGNRSCWRPLCHATIYICSKLIFLMLARISFTHLFQRYCRYEFYHAYMWQS